MTKTFYTVKNTSFRFGDLDDENEKHFEKKEDALKFYEYHKSQYNGEWFYNHSEHKTDSFMKLEVDAKGDKWSYLLEFFEQTMETELDSFKW